jgi:PAS domain S-box-containing protein
MSDFQDMYQLQQRVAELEEQLARETAARIQAEETLRTSEERYRRIVEHTPSGICITNEDGLYEYVNPAYCEMYGYAPDELIGQSFTLVVPEDNQAFMRELHDKYIAGETEVQGEWQVVSRDGRVLTILADAALITGIDGRPKKATFVTNISRRKDAEDTLQRQNEYLQALHDVTLGLLRRLDINDLLKAIVTQAGTLLGTMHGYVYLLESDETDMTLRVGIGLHADATGHRTHKGAGVAGIVWETGETLTVDNYASWPLRPTEFVETQLRSVVGVPLTSGGKVIGVIGLAYTEEGCFFGPAEVEILERFAALASIALDNAYLYTRVQHELEERKRIEADLRLMDGAVRHSTECVLITEAELEQPGPRIVYVNPAFTALTGYTYEEAIGQTPRMLQGTKTDRAMLNELRQTLLRGEPFRAETVNYRKDGTEYFVEWRIAPIKNAEGEITHWVSVQHDTTERKRAEEAIRRLADILEATTDFVGTADVEGRTLYLNQAWKQLAGIGDYQDLSLPGVDTLYPAWARRTLEEEAIPVALQVGIWSGETAVRTHDDREIPVSQVVIVHRKSRDAQVEYLSTIARDISERKQTEEELRRAQQAAEAANHAKSAFLSRMSHELRTPLNAILGFVQVMERDSSASPQQRENLAIIKRSGSHLLGLINDVLELSKIEAGREVLNENSFHLHYFLTGLEELFQVRAKQRGISLRFVQANDVPLFMYGDEGKLRQVLMNLISNAVKFTREGGVTVQVRAQTADSDAEKLLLHFAVEDTGEGIAEEETDAVFEAFSQSQSGKNAQEGTGLGLPISRAFVNLMGGELHFKSTPGVGSVFWFHVCMRTSDAERVKQAEEKPTVTGLVAGQPDYRILVVDDTWENRLPLVKLLESVGFVVREATNGQEALDIWQEWQPQLVWMDMRMPVMDGYEATRRIKETERGNQTVIIALTASAFEHEHPTMLAAGCDDVIVKPFREDQVFDKMAHHLQVRFTYAEDSAPSAAAQEEETLSAETLAKLPADVRDELRQAATTLNGRKANQAIERVRGEYPALADELAKTVKSYRFDVILSLLDGA